jgi:chemotaxis signal transduction protein
VNDGNSNALVTLLQVDSKWFGVPKEQLLTVIDWVEPTPLPFGPEPVFGVVSIQGRMFTVVDIDTVAGLRSERQNTKSIAALRGEDQLAIAVSGAGESVEIDLSSVVPEQESSVFHGRTRVGELEVLLLDVDALFAGVIRGRERRRRRL